MRIQSGYGDTRQGMQSVRSNHVQMAMLSLQHFARDRRSYILKGQMGGCQRYAHAAANEHHYYPAVGQLCQDSVWPVKAMPASFMMPLCTGPVTIALNSPLPHPSTARSSVFST